MANESDGRITKLEGQLEVDHLRGVIYFHSTTTGHTVLRICSLPKPIPQVIKHGTEALEIGVMLDITHMHGVNWLY